MNYDTIKQTAKEYGLKVNDLIALAPANDPFYTGRPSEVAGAEWFANLYRMFGYGGGVHLRRIHYRLVSQETPVTTPNGATYENTQKSWGYLVNVSKWARYLDLVPGNDFVDRRNPDAIILTDWIHREDWNWSDPTPSWATRTWSEWAYTDIPDVPSMEPLADIPDVADYQVLGYRGVQQEYHLELWSEKTTMNDVLLPLCKQFNINLITGAGELSITAVLDLLKRVEAAGRPARILYISDYDPAGLGMPISVARKIEFYQRQFGYDHLDIRLQPLVLTREQVASFDLPRVPVKNTDRRKAKWEQAHGEGQVELDALEALYPGELATIVRHAIVEYIDLSLPGRAMGVKHELTIHMSELRDGVIVHHTHDLALIEDKYRDIQAEYEQTREDFATLAAQFNSRLEYHRQELAVLTEEANTVYSDVRDDMENEYVNMEDYPLPTPDIPTEQDVQLYMSDLDYINQLERYKRYRSGTL